jgi:hypothetical protein
LTELQLHITSGNVEQAKETLARIEQEHLDDPQVAAALYQLLYQTGAIRRGTAPAPPEIDEEPVAAVAAGPEPTGNRIWTPDSDRPSAGKSTLWTPS